MASAHVIHANQNNFEAEVVEASMQGPVLVDFWAAWCAPCKTLMPTLEKLVNEANGALKLAKVNTEEEPQLAQMFGIRSLPTVVLFLDGRPVDGFMGAQPEAAVRAFLAKHVVARPVEEELDAELDTLSPDLEARIEALHAKLSADGGAEETKLELAEALCLAAEFEAAELLIGGLTTLADSDVAKRIRVRLQFAKLAEAAPSAVELQDAIARDPKNLQARHQLAARFFTAGQSAAAFDQWLTILRTDRTYENDLGRRSLIEAFSVTDDADLIGDYRRKLSSALF